MKGAIIFFWKKYHMSQATINNRESIIKKLEADYVELESENRQLRELLNDVIEDRR